MAHIRKHPVTGRPQVRWREPSGRERSKTFARATDARAYKAMIEAEASRGELWDRSRGKTPFNEVAAAWLEAKVGLRRSSWVRDESYLRRHVLPLFGERAVGSITREEVSDWVGGLSASGLAPQTVRQCYRILAQVMAEAVESRLILSSPCRKVALPRVSSASQALFLTPEEVGALAAAIEPRFRALVLVAAYLGLRWGELAGLLVSSLDLSGPSPVLPVVGSPDEESLVGAAEGAARERSERLNAGATAGAEPLVGGATGGGCAEGFGAGRGPEPLGRGAGGSEGVGGCVGDDSEGAARERSERLNGGATAGSDSFGSGGAGLLRVVGTLEEVAGMFRYVSETKSRGGRRTLTLPPFLASELSAHLSSFGSSCSLVPVLIDAPSSPGGTLPSSSFVFTDVDSGVLRGAKFRRRYWKPALARAGLPEGLRFHDLRHTCASLLIAEGAHPKEIQARLGHSSIRTTMDIYGHLLPNLGARLDEGLERMFRGTEGPRG